MDPGDVQNRVITLEAIIIYKASQSAQFLRIFEGNAPICRLDIPYPLIFTTLRRCCLGEYRVKTEAKILDRQNWFRTCKRLQHLNSLCISECGNANARAYTGKKKTHTHTSRTLKNSSTYVA